MSASPPPSLQKELTTAFHGRKVCVTGHTGFKGAWLCEWLLSLGAEVAGFSLPDAPSQPSLFEQLKLADRLRDTRGDVRDRLCVHRWLHQECPDYVFHLAAQPLVRLSYQEPVITWETNVTGTIHVMEGLRQLAEQKSPGAPTIAILITTDKVYENREWLHGYRECDSLGGYDPYSSSKAAAEIAIDSWRKSFFPTAGKNNPTYLASARAGNVIGGGDWAQDRIVPDIVRALQSGQPIPVRNKNSTRPWQHVLEPLSGYLLLAARIAACHASPSPKSDAAIASLCSAFNFGPALESNKTVQDLVKEALKHWPGVWQDRSDPHAPHEAGKLNLVWDKAYHLLGWHPRWDFSTTVQKTVEWYRNHSAGSNPLDLTRRQIIEYSQAAP